MALRKIPGLPDEEDPQQALLDEEQRQIDADADAPPLSSMQDEGTGYETDADLDASIASTYAAQAADQGADDADTPEAPTAADGQAPPPAGGQPGDPFHELWRLLHDKGAVKVDYEAFRAKMQDRRASDEIHRLLVDKIGMKQSADQFYLMVRKNAPGGASSSDGGPAVNSAPGSTENNTANTDPVVAVVTPPKPGEPAKVLPVTPAAANVAASTGTVATVPAVAPSTGTVAEANAGDTPETPAYVGLPVDQERMFRASGGYLMTPVRQRELVNDIQKVMPATPQDLVGADQPRKVFSFNDRPQDDVFYQNPSRLLNQRELKLYHAEGGDVLAPDAQRSLVENIIHRPVTNNDDVMDNMGEINAFITQPKDLDKLKMTFSQLADGGKNRDAYAQSWDKVLEQAGHPRGDATYQAGQAQLSTIWQGQDTPALASIQASLDAKDWAGAAQKIKAMYNVGVDAENQQAYDAGVEAASQGGRTGAFIYAQVNQRSLQEMTQKRDNALAAVYRQAYPIYASKGEVAQTFFKGTSHKEVSPDVTYDNGTILDNAQWGAMAFLHDFDPTAFADFSDNLQRGMTIDKETGLPQYQLWKKDPAKNSLWTHMEFVLAEKGQEINTYTARKEIQEANTRSITINGPLYIASWRNYQRALQDGTYDANKAQIDGDIAKYKKALTDDRNQIAEGQQDLQEAQTDLYTRFPEQMKRRTEMQMMDLTGSDKKYVPGLQRFGEQIAEDVAEGLVGFYRMFVPMDGQDRQKDKINREELEVEDYYPQGHNPTEPQLLTRVRPEDKANIDAIIKNSDYSYDEKITRITDYIKANPGAIYQDPNAAAGGINLNGYALLNRGMKGASTLASYYLMNVLSEGLLAGASKVGVAVGARASTAAAADIAQGTAEMANATKADVTFNKLRDSIEDGVKAGKITREVGNDLHQWVEISRTSWVSESPVTIYKNFFRDKIPQVVLGKAPQIALMSGQSHQQIYNQWIAAGKSPREAQNAAVVGGIFNGVVGAFNPDMAKFRSMLGIQTAEDVLGKDLVSALTPEVMSAGERILAGLKGAGMAYVRNYNKTVLPMAIQNVATIAATEGINKVGDINYDNMYGAAARIRDGFVSTYLDNWLAMLPGAAFSGYRQPVQLQKEALHFAGSQPDIMTSHVNDQEAQGLITPEQASAKRQLINQSAKTLYNKPLKFDGTRLDRDEEFEYHTKQLQLTYTEKAIDDLKAEVGGEEMTEAENAKNGKLHKQADSLRSDLNRLREGKYFTISEKTKRALLLTQTGSTDYDRPLKAGAPINAIEGQDINMPDGTTWQVNDLGTEHIQVRDAAGNIAHYNNLDDFNNAFVIPIFGSKEAFTNANPDIYGKATIRPEGYGTPVSETNPASKLATIPGDLNTKIDLADIADEYHTDDDRMQQVFDWAKEFGGAKGEGAQIVYRANGEKADPVFFDTNTKEIVLNTDSPVVKNMSRADVPELIGHEALHMLADRVLNNPATPEVKAGFDAAAGDLMKSLQAVNTAKITGVNKAATKKFVEDMRRMDPTEMVTYAMTNPGVREWLATVDSDFKPLKKNQLSGPDKANTALDQVEHLTNEFLLQDKPQKPNAEPAPAAGPVVQEGSQPAQTGKTVREVKAVPMTVTTPEGKVLEVRAPSIFVETEGAEPAPEPAKESKPPVMPTQAEGESYFDYAKRAKEWYERVKQHTEAGDANRRQAAIASSEQRQHLDQVKEHAKVLLDANGLLTPDEFNEKTGQAPGSLEPFITASQALMESKEYNTNKKLMRSLKKQMDTLRGDAQKGAAVLDIEAKNLARQWKAYATGYEKGIATTREQEAQALTELEAAGTKDKRRLATIAKLRNDREKKVQEFRDRKNLYDKKVADLIDAYRDSPLMKNKNMTPDDILKLVKQTTRGNSDSSFDNLETIVKGIVSSSNYRADVERIKAAKKEMGKMMQSESLSPDDKDNFGKMRLFDATDVDDPGALADVLEGMIHDRKKFTMGQVATFGTPQVAIFLKNQGKAVLNRMADDVQNSYDQITKSDTYARLNAAGKLQNFPTAEGLRTSLEHITDMPDGFEAARTALDEYKSRMKQMDNFMRKARRANYGTGELDYNGNNDRSTDFLKDDSNPDLIKAKWLNLIGTDTFKKLNNLGLLKNFPEWNTLRQQIDNANPDELRVIGKHLRDLGSTVSKMQYVPNERKDVIDYSGDHSPDPTFLQEDFDREVIKNRYNKMIADPLFAELQAKGLVKNFPETAKILDRIDKAKPNSLKLIGKRIRDVNRIFQEYKRGDAGDLNTEDLPVVDYTTKDTYVPDDRRSQNFKRRFKDMIGDPFFNDMKVQGKLSNFPDQATFDKEVDGLQSEDDIKVMGKKLRNLENTMQELKNTRQKLAALDPTANEIDDATQYIDPVDYNKEETYRLKDKRYAPIQTLTENNQAKIDINDPDLDSKQRSALTILKDINLKTLDQTTLELYNNVLRNVLQNKEYGGFNRLHAIHDAQNDPGRQKFNDLIDNQNYEIQDARFGGFLPKFREETTSKPSMMSRFAGSRSLLTALEHALGTPQLYEGYAKARQEYHDNVEVPLAAILKAHKLKIDDNAMNMRLSIVGHLRQFQNGTPQEQANEMARRVEEWPYDVQHKLSGDEEAVAEGKLEQQELLNLSDKIDAKYGIRIYHKDDAGNLVVNKVEASKLTPDMIMDSGVLSPGERQISDLVVNVGKQTQVPFVNVWRGFGNKDISETDLWNNYAKDAFRTLDVQPDVNFDTEKILKGNYNQQGDAINMDNTATMPRTSGNRLQQLDQDKNNPSEKHVFNTNFLRVQTANLKGIINDIHTLPGLVRMEALFKDPRFERQVGGKENLDILKSALTNELSGLSGSRSYQQSQATRDANKFFSAVRKVAAVKQLGSVVQGPMQFATQMLNMHTDMSTKGMPLLPFRVATDYYRKGVGDDMQRLREKGLIEFRGEQEGGTKTQSDIEQRETTFQEGTKGKVGKAIEKVRETIRGRNKYTGEEGKATLVPLQTGDVGGAAQSYINYYAYYLLKNKAYPDYKSIDWKKEADNPNREAQAFAENSVSTLQNVNANASLPTWLNDPNNAIVKGLIGSFASFNLNKTVQFNEAMRNFVNAGKLTNPQQRREQRGQAISRFISLLTEDAGYNLLLKPAQKGLIQVSAGKILKILGAKDEDDDLLQEALNSYTKGIKRNVAATIIQNIGSRYLNLGPKALTDLGENIAGLFGESLDQYAPQGNDYGTATAAINNVLPDLQRIYGTLIAGWSDTDAKDKVVVTTAALSNILQSIGWFDVTADRTAHRVAEQYAAGVIAEKTGRKGKTLTVPKEKDEE